MIGRCWILLILVFLAVQAVFLSPVFAEDPPDTIQPAQSSSERVYLPIILYGTASSSNNPYEAEIQQIVQQTNQERANAGCPAVTVNAQLMQAAQSHSTEMATSNYFSHTGLDGSLPWDRVTATGYVYSLVGENIAAGPSSASAVMAMWMNSTQGHRETILNCSYLEIGVGVAYNADSLYGYYWTQDFAEPQ